MENALFWTNGSGIATVSPSNNPLPLAKLKTLTTIQSLDASIRIQGLEERMVH